MFDEKRIDDPDSDIENKSGIESTDTLNINKYIETYIHDISNIEYENSKLEKQCTYHGTSFLSKTILLNDDYHVFMIPYYIQNTEHNPFIYFLLEKQIIDSDKSLNFIKIKDIDDTITIKESIVNATSRLFNILKHHPNFQPEYDDIEEFKKKYVGYFKEKLNIYLFYDISNINILENLTLTNNYNYFFSLIYEIITSKHVIGIPVNNNVYDFFKIYPEFLILVNKITGEFINTPVVMYSGNTEKKSVFEVVFGVTKKEIFEDYGMVYKFYSFEDSIDISDKENKKVYGITPSKLSVVRIAVFCDNIIKISSFKLLYDKEIQTTWSNKYDSIYFNVPEIMEHSPILCTKNYNQQIPLTMNLIKNIKYII